MMTFIEKWDHWWTRATPPHTLALIRILFGAYLIFYWCIHLPRAEMLFSTAGLVVPAITSGPLAGLLGPVSPLWTYIIYLSVLPCLILFTLGWDMRLNALVIALFMLYYWQLSFHLYPNTYNRLYLFLLLVLAFSGADRVYSLRMKVERGAWDAYEDVSIWPVRLIAIQLTATFTGVSYQKLWLPLWQDPDALMYPFLGCWRTPFGAWVIQHLPRSSFDVGLWALKIFQCALPIGFWIPKVRVVAIAGASLFLVGVSTLLSIWWFLILIPCFIVFFPPELIKKIVNCNICSKKENTPR